MIAASQEMAPELVVEDLGFCSYSKAYERQLELVEQKKRQPEAPDTLIFVEHPEIYTYGRKSKVIDATLPSVAIERGGEATYHNPGQLVCYPILKLLPAERDVLNYLHQLEATILDLLKELGVPGGRRKGATGVWVGQGRRKIASVGVAITSWVTYHGCALNVNNELAGFLKIDPCGFSGQVMTSIEKETAGARPELWEMKSLKRRFLTHFCRNLHRQVRTCKTISS